jgi:hypothetical protein
MLELEAISDGEESETIYSSSENELEIFIQRLALQIQSSPVDGNSDDSNPR